MCRASEIACCVLATPWSLCWCFCAQIVFAINLRAPLSLWLFAIFVCCCVCPPPYPARAQFVFVGPYLEDPVAFGELYLAMTVGFMAVPVPLPGTLLWKAIQARKKVVHILEDCVAKSRRAMTVDGAAPSCLLDYWTLRCLKDAAEAEAAGAPPPPHTTVNQNAETIMDFLVRAAPGAPRMRPLRHACRKAGGQWRWHPRSRRACVVWVVVCCVTVQFASQDASTARCVRALRACAELQPPFSCFVSALVLHLRPLPVSVLCCVVVWCGAQLVLGSGPHGGIPRSFCSCGCGAATGPSQ